METLLTEIAVNYNKGNDVGSLFYLKSTAGKLDVDSYRNAYDSCINAAKGGVFYIDGFET